MVRLFRDVLQEKDFVVTAEIGPPKGTDVSRLVHHIELLRDRVDALNVTDNQSSVMRVSSLAACRLIVEHGGEPILQLTCRDRNRLALQSELLSAWVLGVRNVLCLTGDYVTVGDHPEAKPVFDLDSVQLLQTVQYLNQGRDLAGNNLEGATDFLAGSVVTPEADPLEPQLVKFAKKVRAGARFFQTQAVYDLDRFRRFMEQARRLLAQNQMGPVKILAGIVLLTSAKMARYMNEHVPGIMVPESLIEQLTGAEKGKALQVGIQIAGRLIRQIQQERLCDGVHIMAIGKEERVPDILAEAGLA
ncbi:MAG TPA: methylenetetrahydrofolate reductase [Thermoguttaceae bacterium]|nr:methylenetetrahydrofolate reductase [Thermoguttaceae bacterium]